MYFSIVRDKLEVLVEYSPATYLAAISVRVLDPEVVRNNLVSIAETFEGKPDECSNYLAFVDSALGSQIGLEIWTAREFKNFEGDNTSYYIPTICETRIPLEFFQTTSREFAASGNFAMAICSVGVQKMGADMQVVDVGAYGVQIFGGAEHVVSVGDITIEDNEIVRQPDEIFVINILGEPFDERYVPKTFTLPEFPRIGGVFNKIAEMDWWYWRTSLESCAQENENPDQYPPCNVESKVIPSRKYTNTYNHTLPFTLRKG